MIKIDVEISIYEKKDEDNERFIDKLTKRIKEYLIENSDKSG